MFSPDSTIHVVDDDDAVRDSLRVLLESYDLRVEDFRSVGDYLAAARETRNACLLLDIHMPGVSGTELLAELRARGNDIPVVVVSGRIDDAIQRTAQAAGAVAVLHKPVREAELMASIVVALRPRS